VKVKEEKKTLSGENPILPLPPTRSRDITCYMTETSIAFFFFGKSAAWVLVSSVPKALTMSALLTKFFFKQFFTLGNKH